MMTSDEELRRETLRLLAIFGIEKLSNYIDGEELVNEFIQDRAKALHEAEVRARIEENQSMESLLVDYVDDPRDYCYNHEKYVAQCYACRQIHWRKIICKEFLLSVRDRLTTLTAEKEKNI